MLRPPEDLHPLYQDRWRRAVTTVQELCEDERVCRVSLAAHGRSGDVWEASLRQKEGCYAWSEITEASPGEDVDWFTFFLELELSSIDWTYLATLVPLLFPNAEIHIPHMIYCGDGICRPPVRQGAMTLAVIYGSEGE